MRGRLGDVKVKRFLNNVVQSELETDSRPQKEYEREEHSEVYRISVRRYPCREGSSRRHWRM